MLTSNSSLQVVGIVDQPVRPVYPFRFACFVLLTGATIWPLLDAYQSYSVWAITALNLAAVPLLLIYGHRLQASLAALAFVAGLPCLFSFEWNVPVQNLPPAILLSLVSMVYLLTAFWLTYSVWRIARKT